jgi:ribosomal protein L32E
MGAEGFGAGSTLLHQQARVFLATCHLPSTGIDNRVRRRFKGALPMPKIGYGSNKKTRHLLPIGFQKFVVANVKDLELLLMHNRWGAGWVA